MSQEGHQAKLHDVSDFSVREDEDLVRWTLDGMVSKQVFQQFQSILGLELLLQHSVEDKVKNGQHS